MLDKVTSEPTDENVYLAGTTVGLFAEIYEPNTQLINWQRQFGLNIQQELDHMLSHADNFSLRLIIKPELVSSWLHEKWQKTPYPHLQKDIEKLVTLFADLFEISQVGVRLELLDKTVCPLFHVDKVMCRMVTTYQGLATEWVTYANTNRDALKARQYDDIVFDPTQIRHAEVGEVLLFKGQNWSDNESGGIVHRSALASKEHRRLLLTLDLI